MSKRARGKEEGKEEREGGTEDAASQSCLPGISLGVAVKEKPPKS